MKLEGAAAVQSSNRTMTIFIALALVVAVGGFAAYAWNSGSVARVGSAVGVNTGAPLFTFEGGKMGVRFGTETPFFDVKPDWSAEIEVKGDFEQIELVPEEPSETNPSEYLRTARHRLRNGKMEESITRGGRFKIQLFGDGVWRVTIRQGTGKI